MLVREIYEALSTLERKEALAPDSRILDFLREQGLVNFLGPADYQKMQDQVARLPGLQDFSSHLQRILEFHSQEISKMSTRPAGFLFFRKQAPASQETIGLITRESLYRRDDKQKTDEEIRKLESIKKDLERCIGASEVYILPTAAATVMREEMRIRLPRLETTDYGKFTEEFEAAKSTIDRRYARFQDCRRILTQERGFADEYTTYGVAAALSLVHGDIDRITGQADEIDMRMVDNLKWDSKDLGRLRAVSLIMSGENPNERLDDTIGIYRRMIADGHKECNKTLAEAATILDTVGSTPDAKYRRSERMQDALDAREWGRRKFTTCYIGDNLCQREGDPDSIAAQFRSTETKLISVAGIDDSVESGIAALILLDGNNEIAHKARQFQEAYADMRKYGWQDSRFLYGAAARIAMLQGCIEENVKMAHDMKERMHQDRFKADMTYRAIDIISGRYVDIIPTENKE